ncbi:hypothetical protein SUGI_1226890 [Cryptomeria japonica]|uniref:Uncharacterized protein n=1 Tax=Cryptomeria japonica TaxID=3369 RepID=A0AAD3NRW8_CRYJA|nr:hypothetical protein SUGI_1226890 [Cryptomeria japonica]
MPTWLGMRIMRCYAYLSHGYAHYKLESMRIKYRYGKGGFQLLIGKRGACLPISATRKACGATCGKGLRSYGTCSATGKAFWPASATRKAGSRLRERLPDLPIHKFFQAGGEV